MANSDFAIVMQSSFSTTEPLIIGCRSGSRSRAAVLRLRELGFTHLLELKHGFEGTRIETKDGLTIDGIVVDAGDPVVIKSMGGLSQEVPKDRVKVQKPLGRSLMFVPDALGLTPQAIADIVAYLQSPAPKN